MLIRNQISLKYIVSFYLTFDDPELNKNIEISVGDIVRIAYTDMKNRINKRVTGKVSEIRTDRVKNNNLITNVDNPIELYNDEVILKIDGSTEYGSNVVSIMGRDILDIDKYPFEEDKKPEEDIDPESPDDGDNKEPENPDEKDDSTDTPKDPEEGEGNPSEGDNNEPESGTETPEEPSGEDNEEKKDNPDSGESTPPSEEEEKKDPVDGEGSTEGTPDSNTENPEDKEPSEEKPVEGEGSMEETPSDKKEDTSTDEGTQKNPEESNGEDNNEGDTNAPEIPEETPVPSIDSEEDTSAND